MNRVECRKGGNHATWPIRPADRRRAEHAVGRLGAGAVVRLMIPDRTKGPVRVFAGLLGFLILLVFFPSGSSASDSLWLRLIVLTVTGVWCTVLGAAAMARVRARIPLGSQILMSFGPRRRRPRKPRPVVVPGGGWASRWWRLSVASAVVAVALAVAGLAWCAR